MRITRVFVVCVFLLSLFSCHKNNIENENVAGTNGEEITIEIDPAFEMAVKTVLSLDDRLLAAQILICGIDGSGRLPPHQKELFEDIPPGGVMLFRYNLNTDNDSIRSLLKETVSLIKNESGIYPFMAVDHEGGTVNRFMPGIASLPAASSYWELSLAEGKQAALEKIENDSFRAGLEISGFGINLNFAPVAEYLNDDNRVFLESRSYGTDPFFTAQASAAFIRGMERAGVICVIKHFPGSAGVDPHYSSSVLNLDRAALDNLVYPFTELIKNGARALMVAHSAVPAMDNKIASLSPVVMNNWLRDDLGFSGIIISDDFIMAAAGSMNSEEAAIQSVTAGADMVLVWPSDLKRTHSAFVSSLEDGRLSRERAREAAARIIYEKIRMGLIDAE